MLSKSRISPDKPKVTSNETNAIAADCNNILAFLQTIAVKLPRVETGPLSLRADKWAKDWFRKWFSHHLAPLTTPISSTPHDYLVLKGLLIDVASWLQNEEATHPVIWAQLRVDQDTKGWDRLPPMSQRVILAVISLEGLNILSALSRSINILSINTMQMWYKRIVPWPTKVIISTHWHTSSETSYRATSWRYLNWTLPQGYPPSKPLHNRPSQKMKSSMRCWSRSYWMWDSTVYPRNSMGSFWSNGSTWLKTCIAPKQHKEPCAGLWGLLGNWS